MSRCAHPQAVRSKWYVYSGPLTTMSSLARAAIACRIWNRPTVSSMAAAKSISPEAQALRVE